MNLALHQPRTHDNQTRRQHGPFYLQNWKSINPVVKSQSIDPLDINLVRNNWIIVVLVFLPNNLSTVRSLVIIHNFWVAGLYIAVPVRKFLT